MSTLLGLAGVMIVCIAAVWFFSPRYGAGRGCTGRALEAAMEQEKERKNHQGKDRKPDIPESSSERCNT